MARSPRPRAITHSRRVESELGGGEPRSGYSDPSGKAVFGRLGASCREVTISIIKEYGPEHIDNCSYYCISMQSLAVYLSMISRCLDAACSFVIECGQFQGETALLCNGDSQPYLHNTGLSILR